MANNKLNSEQRLELLSTYLDDETTPEETLLVQQLLQDDPQFQRDYQQMSRIRHGFQTMPVPASQSHQKLSNQVWKRLRWKRSKVISLWGGGAIAALFIAGVVSNIPRTNSNGEFAQNNPVSAPTTELNNTVVAEDEELVVALNRPVLQIPKLATATDATP